MAENSNIAWTDHTFNPWIGCTKVSPGCANCYAAGQDKLRRWTAEGWGKGKPRKRTSPANWNEPRKWNRAAADAATRPRVFCASLADWLDDEVPIEWLADLLALIHDTPNLDWQLLTKRPDNWRKRANAAVDTFRMGTLEERWGTRWLEGEPPPNIWLGTTTEDQQRADERIPALLSIPARVRFLSCEPMLGPLNLLDVPTGWPFFDTTGQPSIHWIIAGGESGPGHRPLQLGWLSDLAAQCDAARVPLFVKQDSGHRPGQQGRIPAHLWQRKEFPSP